MLNFRTDATWGQYTALVQHRSCVCLVVLRHPNRSLPPHSSSFGVLFSPGMGATYSRWLLRSHKLCRWCLYIMYFAVTRTSNSGLQKSFYNFIYVSVNWNALFSSLFFRLGLFQLAGFDPERVVEWCGNINYLQVLQYLYYTCLRVCIQYIYNICKTCTYKYNICSA